MVRDVELLTPSPNEYPTVESLRRLRRSEPDARLQGRNGTKASILVYRHPGPALAVKDYLCCNWVVRNTLGRWSIGREARAYAAAGPIDGLPPFLGRLDPFAMALGWVEAEPLAGRRPESVPTGTFVRLARIVAALHDRGVAIGDLHHRDILLAANGSVYLVDLATAVVLGERPGPWRRALFERHREADLVAVARLRARYRGHDEAAAIEAVGSRAARRHRLGRRLKGIWNRLRGA